MKLWSTISFLVLVLPPAASGQTTSRPDTASILDRRFDALRSRIERGVRMDSLVSLSVAVAVQGNVVWEEAFGWADRERRIRATPHTMYSLASVSKPITATGLMVLRERRRLGLDRSVNQLLGGAKLTAFLGNADKATVRHLLWHTSGLPTHYRFIYSDESIPVPSMDETIARYGILVNPPGAVYEYSNLGYGVLSYLIERLSGRSFADFMRAEVFGPLGMIRASVDIGPGLAAFAATRYTADRRPIPFYTFDHPGASAVFASGHDLLRFALFHLKEHLPDQRPILADSTIEAMQANTVPLGWAPGSRGLGWGIEERNGYRIVSHGGGMPGVTTVLKLMPSKRIAVAVLTNSPSRNDGLPVTLADDVLGVLVPGYALSQSGAAPVSQSRPRYQPTPDLIGEWTGELRTWQETLPVRMVFQPDGDVHIKLGEQLETLVNNVRFSDGTLGGQFLATIPTEDARRHRHFLGMSLTLRERTLSGAVTARTLTDRSYYALASWLSVTKQVPAGGR